MKALKHGKKLGYLTFFHSQAIVGHFQKGILSLPVSFDGNG
jgi:hypothetical protein